ncbi:unnamed protein product, partial [Allacma fusca]
VVAGPGIEIVDSLDIAIVDSLGIGDKNEVVGNSGNYYPVVDNSVEAEDYWTVDNSPEADNSAEEGALQIASDPAVVDIAWN